VPGDVRECLACHEDDFVHEIPVIDVVETRVDVTARDETESNRRIRDDADDCVARRTFVVDSARAAADFTHAVDDAALQGGKFTQLLRDVGGNTVDEGIETQASREDVLERAVVEIARDAICDSDAARFAQESVHNVTT
jgi:hypothetical protein